MIYCLLTAKHAYTWNNFLESWGKSLAGRISVLAYEDVVKEKRKWDTQGVHIFCDLDRLTRQSRDLLSPLHRSLCDVCGSRRVLNDPVRSMHRYELLRTLHAAGLNRFGVQWLKAREVPEKFPVLLRRENTSTQMPVAFVKDELTYRSVVAQLEQAKAPLDNFITVEFCETADDAGVYRKYGAFIIGRTIVPRHLFFSRNWLVKKAELSDAHYLAEEMAYIDANPHADALGRIARIADISYGRIDYSVLDGNIQTWEINTNPMLVTSISGEIPGRRDAHLKFLGLFEGALEALERH